MTTKICAHCHNELPTSAFYTNSTKSDGLQSDCIACKSEMDKNWKRKNPEQYKQSQRKYQISHPEKMRANQKNYRDRLRNNDPVEFYSRTTWTSLQQRVSGGLYSSAASLQTNPQHLSYFRKGVICTVTKDEYFEFWKKNSETVFDIIKSGDKPSIDRIDPNGNYSIDNIQIISLTENRKKDRVRTTGKEYVYDKEQKKIENRRMYVKTHKKDEE